LVSGMTIGTVFTLFVVPSIYMVIAKQHKGMPDADSVNGVDELANGLSTQHS